MAEDDPDRDEEWFNEVYGKEYTGPLSRARQPQEPERKKPAAAQVETSDEEEEGPRDPNAVPTDFTSREAKVWEAKAKAIERNWKRRKEEELHCKICGEAGHFAQVSFSTLLMAHTLKHKLVLHPSLVKEAILAAWSLKQELEGSNFGS